MIILAVTMGIFDAPMVVAALEDITFVMDMKIAWMVQMKEWIVSLLLIAIMLIKFLKVHQKHNEKFT